jgi:PKD repeat protein/endonuclease/exonuclease/phosphatase family metal-dependent hydrolase
MCFGFCMGKLSTYLVVALLWCCVSGSTHAQQVKVMQWNVLGGLGRKSNNTNAQAQAIARIVNFNQPDVLLFNEVDANNQSASVNEAAIIDWVTNNVPYLGTQPGVTFYVKASTQSDGFERNAAISRFPILAAVNYNDGLRGLHSLRLQLAGANQLQVYHAHLKCCNDDCPRKQAEAQFDSDIIRTWAATNSLPYIFAGDWNEDESNPICVLSSTYRPITMIRTNGSLVEFVPTALNGNSKTISTATTNPTRRYDYCLAGSNRLSAVSGYVFNTKVWAANGLYTNAGPQNLTTDNATASDHYCVFVNYFFPTDIFVVETNTFDSAGAQGGPFNPSNRVYTLSNAGTVAANWRVTKTATWLDISATNGTLSASASTNIAVSVNATANTLSQGTYTDTIRFSNTVTGVSVARAGSLAVFLRPMANFTATPTNGPEPLTVTFTDISTGDISNRFWDFGDGDTLSVTTNVVMHTYSPGNYSVTLIATGPVGVSTNTKPNHISAWTPFQSWQLQYFGCTNCPQAQAGADPLGKGMSNTNQFLAGLNPTNPASVFRITSILVQGTNTVITWKTAGGRTNILQGSPGDFGNESASYLNQFYTIPPPIIIPGVGDAITNFVDDGSWWGEFSNWPARYYRVRVQP